MLLFIPDWYFEAIKVDIELDCVKLLQQEVTVPPLPSSPPPLMTQLGEQQADLSYFNSHTNPLKYFTTNIATDTIVDIDIYTNLV